MATTDVNEDKVISAYREKVARDKLIENLTANVLINELFENPEGKVIPAAVVPQNSTGTVTVGVKPVPRTLDVALCAQSLSSSLSDGPDGHIGMESVHDAEFYGEKLMEHYDEMLKGKVADKSRIRVVASTPFELYLMDAGIFWNSDKTACVRRVAFVIETPILARDVKSADEIMAEMDKE